MIRVYLSLLAVVSVFGCGVSGSPDETSSIDQTLVLAGSAIVPVSGSSFQFAGNVDASTQLYVAQVNNLSPGQTVSYGSVAVQCAGTGGGYFVPCTRTREVGAWQCGTATACGSSSGAPLPFQTAFVVGSQSHLDIGLLASAPTFVSTNAVLTANDCTLTTVSPSPNFAVTRGGSVLLQASSQCATNFDYFVAVNGLAPALLAGNTPSVTWNTQVSGSWCVTASASGLSSTVCGVVL